YSLIIALPNLNIITPLLGILSLLIVIYSHKILKKIPSPLLAMVIVTLSQYIFKFKGVATIGSVFGNIPHSFPSPHLPLLSFNNIISLLGSAFTIAILGAIESLLSATAADGLANTKHNPNQELIGQGIANCLSPLFGGFAATGAIARTATNIRNGGNNPTAAIVHALFLLVIILALAPIAQYIPLCSLAAILFVVAFNMSNIPHFFYIIKNSTTDDKLVLLTTFTLTIFTDLVIAVNIGIVLAMLFFMRRITQNTKIEEQKASITTISLENEDKRPKINTEKPTLQFKRNILIYSISGPFFFAITEKFAETLAITHTKAKAVIFDFKEIPFIDFTGLLFFQETVERLTKFNITIYLYRVNEKIKLKFIQTGLMKLVEQQRSFPTLTEIAQYDNNL
ncbi:MAG: SulP family inorganic anion transporter, partial [Bacteroidia bacterium]